MKMSYCLSAVFLIGACTVSMNAADEIKPADAARKVLDQYRQALVTVKVNLRTKTTAAGREFGKKEKQVEATGVRVSPDGLVVVALTAINNPGAGGALNIALGGDGDGDAKVKTHSEVIGVKFMDHDGRETPAKIALRDKDLDLAFLLPAKEQKGPTTHVKLDQGAKPTLLNELLVLRRLGAALNRQSAVRTCRVEAIVAKPRTYLVPSSSLSESTLGCPVFDKACRLVGIVTSHSAPGTKDAEESAVVILPTADVAEAASQVQEAAGKADGKNSR